MLAIAHFVFILELLNLSMEALVLLLEVIIDFH